MERFPVELLYVLAFAGIILFNYVMQRAARRRQQEEEAQAQAAAPAPAEEAPLEDIWGRTPAPAAPAAPVIVTRPAPIRAEPPAPRRLHPVRALLKERRDLRRAVILTMVLGPCRAQEPPER
jgi:hypothetical protein